MKPLPIKVLGDAEADIDAITDWYHNEAGEAVAERFRKAVNKAVLAIGDNPELGSFVGSSRDVLSAMRKRSVAGFARYLVFYVVRDGAVEIVRVLHSAQDWWSDFEVD